MISLAQRWAMGSGLLWIGLVAQAQIDPYSRNLLELGFDQPIRGQGPQAIYAYYYYNKPDFLRTNMPLRLAFAPAYLDSELGLRQFLFPHTDLGLGLAGGVFGDNHYEVRQGRYWKEESFYGHGGGASLSVYQRLNPGKRIPVNLILRGGFRYLTYARTDRTDDPFQLPENRVNYYARTGVRIGGKEPRLYPDLAMELSVWYEHQWRSDSGVYGYGDRYVNGHADLYWLFAGLNYAWTNTGHKIELGFTAGGSQSADRFSAWRLGGVLPLVAEYPLILPGYYYQEISAEHFAHLSAYYSFGFRKLPQWKVRIGAATACVDYLPGFEQPRHWHAGVGGGLAFTSRNRAWRVILRYGYGFNALRDGERGAHSLGLLFQHDFNIRKRRTTKVD